MSTTGTRDGSSSRIRVHVHGADGRMGSTCVSAIEGAPDMELVGRSDRDDDFTALLAREGPDVVVDFTTPAVVAESVRTALEAGCHVVSGTTGLAPERAQELGDLAARRERGFLLAPNFAIGVILMQRFAREAAQHFEDVEIIEMHHEAKVDAPSGTALHTAASIAAAAARPLNRRRPADAKETLAGARGGWSSDVPIHSVRLPGLLAHQEVLFGGAGELLTIRHDTTDRRAFMPGVLLGVRKIGGYRGLVDSLERLL
jgi:4-hydroxy-tetrahydrodipicolinate reductase